MFTETNVLGNKKVSLNLTKVDLITFLQEIYRDAFEKNGKTYVMDSRFTMTYNVNTALAIDYYLNFREKDIVHFIPNTFSRIYDKKGYIDRTKDNLRHLCAMAFDFELKKSDITSYSPNEVMQIFIEKTGFAPAFVTTSKSYGHYHVYILHEFWSGHKKSIDLWEKVQKMIAKMVGCDMGACNAVHPFRIPTNVIWKNTNYPVYSIQEMKNWWIKCIRLESEVHQKVKIVSISEKRVWKHPAIEALLECNLISGESRNHACFTVALFYYVMKKTKKQCLEFLLKEWMPKAKKIKQQRFYISEIRCAVKSAYSGHYKGPSKEWIERLTGVEFNLYLYANARLRKTDYNLKNENINAILNFFREHNGEVTMTKKELTESICKRGYAFKSIDRHLYNLKEQGVLEWQEGMKGRTPRPTLFKLNDWGKKEEKEIIVIDDKDDQTLIIA